MKHVPNGRAERKAVKDGTQGPKKKKHSQGWDPTTHERKSGANSRQSCDLIVRAMEKEESENPRIQYELSNSKSLCYQVGGSGDRSVQVEKELQQAEKNKDSTTQKKSRELRRRRWKKSPDDADEVISRS